jgi:outer membrane protein TolC
MFDVVNALAALAVAAFPQAAQGPGDTLRLAAAVQMAREANPMLRAARLKADAAAERVPQAGALPSPELTLGLMNRMVSGFGATTDPMTMNQVQLTQELPWPGKLGNARAQARQLADAAGLDADDAELMLVARVTGTYYDLAYMDRALALMARSRDLLREFVQVSQAMYAVGTGLQQDVLQSQVAVARMTEEITVMTQERVAGAARLNALLGRSAAAAIGPLDLPHPGDSLPGVDSLMSLAAIHRPKLRAAQERATAAQAGYRAARRELYPDLMLGVSYGQRPQFDDMASVMLGFRLPLWAGRRELPLRRETQAMQAMAEAEARDTYNETYAQLVEMRADAERSRNLTQLYASSIVPQARASVEAALAAYRVGKVDYLSVVENQMTANRYETEGVRLLAAYHKAVAEIDALVGGSPGGER